MKDSRIVRLSPDKTVVNLTPDFHSACDPAVSFDAQWILFSGKKTENDPWQIWRMDRDGGHLQCLTPEMKDCFSPLFVGTLFHLDDDAPSDQIIFTSAGRNQPDNTSLPSLYVTGLDGQNPERITYNIGADIDPDVLPNGRLVYASQRNDDSATLLAVNNDGTDLMLYGETQGQFIMPRVGTDRVYFIEPKFLLGGGNLAYVSQRRPMKTYKTLCQSSGGRYLSPCPLPDGGLLASYLNETVPQYKRFDLYRIDPETGENLEEIYRDDNWSCLDAQVFSPHPKVKGRSTVVKLHLDTGTFYCMNVYESDRPDAESIKPESIKSLRVIEGIPTEQSFISPLYGKLATNRILGVIPIEPDGSFYIEVPARIPIRFQTLGENGMALQTQDTWTWVLPDENRGCVGCHEDRELSPPNLLVQAVTKPAVRLLTPPEQRRTVDFLHQIKPIVEANCSVMGCHGDVSYKDYNSLMDSAWGKNIVAGSAKNSPLIWHLFGKKLGENSNSDMIMPMPPKKPLLEQERTLFIEWIDLGATWYSPTESPGSENKTEE